MKGLWRRAWQRVAGIEITTAETVLVCVGLVLAVFLRLWQLNKLGFNSDEAVYSGQAAAIANDPVLKPFFPVFRAHPLLFQTILSLGYRLGTGDLFARLLADLFGAGTVVVTFLTGRLLYGRRAGVIAALLLALMPYEIVVSRQVLLDGPMAFFATVTLYLLARAILSQRLVFLYAAGGTMGLTALTKETGILMMGGAFVFFLLSPEIRIRAKHALGAAGVTAAVILAYPLALRFAAHTHAGQKYLTYQLFRRPNHSWFFYPTTVPEAMGLLVVAGRTGRALAAAARDLVAGDPASLLDRRAGTLLPALSRQGLPVPDRLCAARRAARRPNPGSLAAQPGSPVAERDRAAPLADDGRRNRQLRSRSRSPPGVRSSLPAPPAPCSRAPAVCRAAGSSAAGSGRMCRRARSS